MAGNEVPVDQNFKTQVQHSIDLAAFHAHDMPANCNISTPATQLYIQHMPSKNADYLFCFVTGTRGRPGRRSVYRRFCKRGAPKTHLFRSCDVVLKQFPVFSLLTPPLSFRACIKHNLDEKNRKMRSAPRVSIVHFCNSRCSQPLTRRPGVPERPRQCPC
jgi:hypothetical protein